jgi:fatty-acid desaturase
MALPRQGSPTTIKVSTPTKEEKTAGMTAAEAAQQENKAAAPWWRRGGMNCSGKKGMELTILTPPYILYLSCREFPQVQTAFLILWIGGIVSAIFLHGMRTSFCVVAVPTYMASLVYAFSLPNPTSALLIALTLAILKVGICMSVCLHRYAAHAAFKCSESVRFGIMLLGCLANQGGPIWWASQHRCHHKYCDVPRDPHSQTVDGVEQAFAFFGVHSTVNEEFAPKHCDTVALRFLDTWSFLPIWVELLLAYRFGGPTGLFIHYVGSWMCQTMTLWFNLANHPILPSSKDKTCTAQDDKGPLMVYYPAFVLLNTLYPVFGLFVAERNHKHHHDNANLAKRSTVDGAYFIFVYPLEKLGIIWDVKVPKKFD